MTHTHILKLKEKLKGKVLFIGIGNTLRGDDGAGPELIKRLKHNDRYSLMDVGEVPENYLQKIVNEKPDTIVMVDTVGLGKTPGEIEILQQKNIVDNSLSTHNASLKIVIQYIKSEINADIILLGIQPKTIEFGKSISLEVSKSIDEIIKAL